jgi:hypothetical protein
VPPTPPPSPFTSPDWGRFAAADEPPPASWGELFDDRPPLVVPSVLVEHLDIGGVVASALESLTAP